MRIMAIGTCARALPIRSITTIHSAEGQRPKVYVGYPCRKLHLIKRAGSCFLNFPVTPPSDHSVLLVYGQSVEYIVYNPAPRGTKYEPTKNDRATDEFSKYSPS